MSIGILDAGWKSTYRLNEGRRNAKSVGLLRGRLQMVSSFSPSLRCLAQRTSVTVSVEHSTMSSISGSGVIVVLGVLVEIVVMVVVILAILVDVARVGTD